ncbi:acetate--CoA ligase family protein [Eubacteriales bacterium OttesenSCG-928-A19]|nr:acetate--CoA ligase family protein [Eubacteriales bacterium OttesenSCG-928-A19]
MNDAWRNNRMKLMEFQGKEIFRACGLRVPEGRLLREGDETSDLRVPVLLKAQVMTGGRGKAGGIRMVEDPAMLRPELDRLFSMTIKEEAVAAVLAVEEAVEIRRELYLSITFQGGKGDPVLIASGAGGVEIENIAKADPAKIVKLPLDPMVGVTAYQARYLAKRIDYPDVQGLLDVMRGLYRAFTEYDASLVEINPLAVTDTGLVALDSKVVLDDKAAFRHRALFERLTAEQGDVAEKHREDTITFVGMEGNVALISDGAGTGMLSLDLVHDAGARVNSFCELGGVTNADVMYTAIQETLAYPGAKSLLVVLIGGFNRMDHMAEGIRRYLAEHVVELPIVVRMCGTKEDEGKRMLADAGIATVDDLNAAVAEAVRLGKGA